MSLLTLFFQIDRLELSFTDSVFRFRFRDSVSVSGFRIPCFSAALNFQLLHAFFTVCVPLVLGFLVIIRIADHKILHHIIRQQCRKRGIVRPSHELFAKSSSRLQIRFRIRISKKVLDVLARFIFNARFSYFQEKNSYSKSNDWGYAIALLGVLSLIT